MSEQRRTSETPYVIDNFGGAHDLTDELKVAKELVPWLTGMYQTERGTLVKIPGKLATTGVIGGPIATLSQMTFADKTLVLIHRDYRYMVEDDVSSLVIPDPTPMDTPLNPVML